MSFRHGNVGEDYVEAKRGHNTPRNDYEGRLHIGGAFRAPCPVRLEERDNSSGYATQPGEAAGQLSATWKLSVEYSYRCIRECYNPAVDSRKPG